MRVEPADLARRFPVQPASALAPRPPTVAGDRRAHSTTGTVSTVVHVPEPERPVEVVPETRRKLTGYPGHTSHRAQRRLQTVNDPGSPRSQNGMQVQQQRQADDTTDRLEQAGPPASAASVGNAPGGGGEGTATVVVHREDAVPEAANPATAPLSCPLPPVPAHPLSTTATTAADGAPPAASPNSSRAHRNNTLHPLPIPGAQHRTNSRSSMLTAGDGDGERRSRGALSANQIARVERSEQRKVLLEQQLALERAYWNTKASFQGLRSQAEKQIYSRELTALWTERTDGSPYWTNQVQEMEAAHAWTRQWRRHPEYVQSARNEANAAKQQLLGNTFSGVALSLLHHDAGAAFDHRLTAPMPPMSWKSVTCLYEQQPARITRPLSPPHQPSPAAAKSPRSTKQSPRHAPRTQQRHESGENGHAGASDNTGRQQDAGFQQQGAPREAEETLSSAAPQWTSEPPPAVATASMDDTAEAPTQNSDEL